MDIIWTVDIIQPSATAQVIATSWPSVAAQITDINMDSGDLTDPGNLLGLQW